MSHLELAIVFRFPGISVVKSNPFNLINALQAGCDRMAADLAMELKSKNVAMVSLWPGPVRYHVFVRIKHVQSRVGMKNPTQKTRQFL